MTEYYLTCRTLCNRLFARHPPAESTAPVPETRMPRQPSSPAALLTVILWLAAGGLAGGQTRLAQPDRAEPNCAEPDRGGPDRPEPRFRAGRLDAPAIAESSGLVASRVHAGVFWTHNDSGNPPELFAVTAAGKLLRTYAVAAKNVDWEDVAIDDRGRLYLADVGNNGRDRREVYVHAVAEPDPAAAPPPAGRAAALPVERTWTLRYPGQPFDAESLVVHKGVGYLIAKQLDFRKATVYAFDLDPAKPAQTLRAVVDLPVRFPVTAADWSADGRWLAVMTVRGPYLFRVDGDVAAAAKVEPKQVTFVSPKMEACAVTADGVLATTEDRDVLLFRWKDFGVKDGDVK